MTGERHAEPAFSLEFFRGRPICHTVVKVEFFRQSAPTFRMIAEKAKVSREVLPELPAQFYR
jgi:hypothetical protein